MRPDGHTRLRALDAEVTLKLLLHTEDNEKWMPNEDREKLLAAQEVLRRMQQ